VVYVSPKFTLRHPDQNTKDNKEFLSGNHSQKRRPPLTRLQAKRDLRPLYQVKTEPRGSADESKQAADSEEDQDDLDKDDPTSVEDKTRGNRIPNKKLLKDVVLETSKKLIVKSRDHLKTVEGFLRGPSSSYQPVVEGSFALGIGLLLFGLVALVVLVVYLLWCLRRSGSAGKKE